MSEIWTSQRGQGSSIGKIWQFAPRGYIKHTRRNHSGAIEEIVGENGSVLRFDTVESFKKNPMGSESSDWDFVHVDEPCPEDMFKAVARGLVDREGSAWFTLTPLSEFWINDLFFPRPGLQQVYKIRREAIWAQQGHMADNPFLTKQAIEDYIALLSPEEIECRTKGIPLELSGLVYKSFNFSKHVLQKLPHGWTAFDQPPKNYSIYLTIDTHPQTPMAVLFVAVAPTGQKFIYDEIWMKASIEDLSKVILTKLDGYSYAIPKCEPNAWINDPITESSIAEEFMKNGLLVEKSSKAKAFGIVKMNGELSKEGNIFVSPQVQRFLFEINRYCYDKENKPVDKDDHMMENMYRLFINDPIYFDASGQSFPITEEDHAISRAELSLPDITLD